MRSNEDQHSQFDCYQYLLSHLQGVNKKKKAEQSKGTSMKLLGKIPIPQAFKDELR